MALRKISIHSKSWLFLFLWPLVLLRANCTAQAGGSSEPLPQPTFVGDYVVVDTAQVTCYDANGLAAACPSAGDSFYGQDAQYTGHAPSYTDNGDGTVTDNNTGLMWQQAVSEKMNYAEAVAARGPFHPGRLYRLASPHHQRAVLPYAIQWHRPEWLQRK